MHTRAHTPHGILSQTLMKKKVVLNSLKMDTSEPSSLPSKKAGTKKKVIVVGGGVGGMAVAGRLARERNDWQIVLLEKNDKGVYVCLCVWVYM